MMAEKKKLNRNCENSQKHLLNKCFQFNLVSVSLLRLQQPTQTNERKEEEEKKNDGRNANHIIILLLSEASKKRKSDHLYACMQIIMGFYIFLARVNVHS